MAAAAEGDAGISSTTGATVNRSLLAKAHYLMRIFALRRLKTEVEQGLPPKLETKINCPMSPMQRFWVQRLLMREEEIMTKMYEVQRSMELADSVQGRRANNGRDTDLSSSKKVDIRRLKALVFQLRKACNHPFLFPGVEKPTVDGLPTEDIVLVSGKMVVLDRLLKKLEARGHRVAIFSQYTRMLDIISDFLTMRGYNHCQLDGRTNRVMREVHINMFNKAG